MYVRVFYNIHRLFQQQLYFNNYNFCTFIYYWNCFKNMLDVTLEFRYCWYYHAYLKYGTSCSKDDRGIPLCAGGIRRSGNKKARAQILCRSLQDLRALQSGCSSAQHRRIHCRQTTRLRKDQWTSTIKV